VKEFTTQRHVINICDANVTQPGHWQGAAPLTQCSKWLGLRSITGGIARKSQTLQRPLLELSHQTPIAAYCHVGSPSFVRTSGNPLGCTWYRGPIKHDRFWSFLPLQISVTIAQVIVRGHTTGTAPRARHSITADFSLRFH
jgi:hypothetical protein